MIHSSARRFKHLALSLMALACALPLHAIAQTDIASSPLVTGATNVIKPNIMYILDDSGSMSLNYMPDNASQTGNCRSNANCGGTGSRGTRFSSSPPMDAKEFNTLAYNPAVQYAPPPDYDGLNTTYKSYNNAAAGQLWNAVKNDPFLNDAGTHDVAAQYRERWWCDGSQSSTQDLIRCRQNGARVQRPALSGTVSGGGNAPTVSGGGPYTITVDVTAAYDTASGSRHGCAAGDSVTISGLTPAQANGTFRIVSIPNSGRFVYQYTSTSNAVPAAGAALVSSACIQAFPVQSASRISSGTPSTVEIRGNGQSGCFIGDSVTVAGLSNSVYNGTFTVSALNGADRFRYSVPTDPGSTAPASATNTRMTFSACNVPMAQLTSTGTTATATFITAHGCAVGEQVTIRGASQTGYNVTATITSVPANNRFTYAVAAGLATPATLASAAVPIRSTVCAATTSSYATGTGTQSPILQGYPQGIFSSLQIADYSPFYYTIYPNEFCTTQDLTNCQSTVQTTAFPFPATVRYCATTTAQQAVPGSTLSTRTSSTAGCQRTFQGSFTEARYGYFVRSDINSGIASYAKSAARDDCAGATCTYNEEMTNFANWYAYYRVRMSMMKSSTARAFHLLNPTNANAAQVAYRIGFHTINDSLSLNIAPFAGDTAGGQKALWFDKLFATVPTGSTPLRTALARVGRYYAGAYASSAPFNHDPVEYSCQQNFAFLTTDGYWNGGGGVKIDGTAVGDQDGTGKTIMVDPDAVPVTTTPMVRPFLDSSSSATSDGAGSLADVAFYYYNTDLRTASNNPIGSLGGTNDVTANNVPPTTKDPATWQHMTTFTMGLGLDSTLVYAANYDTGGTSADYNAIVNGTKDWPVPASGTITAVDDLWHAAVNGRGTYFSAKDPEAVISGLLSAFAGFQERSGTAAAAATSNPNIVSGDNFLFSSTFTTQSWYGDVTRQQIDIDTGLVSSVVDWSAQAQLDLQGLAASDTRTIKTFDAAGTNNLRDFVWANLNTTEKGYFNGTYVPHYNTLDATQQAQLACASCGQKIVDYIRGQRGYEANTNDVVVPDPAANALFRKRVHILGDIVSAEAVYVKTPSFGYADKGYSSFKTTGVAATRAAMVYVAANDGMLHAFNASTGAEVFAYVPTHILPNLVRLTDKQYDNNHIYYVDGTPAMGDICTANCSDDPVVTPAAVWKTILVGGLGGGGRGYYALDITDPTDPKGLWEFKASLGCVPNGATANTPFDPVTGAAGAPFYADCDVGLSFGNPIITKRGDGKWVVLVTSGYNNLPQTTPFNYGGTGGGFLYVLDAATGEILNKIATLVPVAGVPTNAGSAAAPSGLSRINAFATNTDSDNTTLRVYGGDLNGNLWRFDNLGALGVTGNTAKLLAIFGTGLAAGATQGNGTQPITARPELGEVVVSGVTHELVFIGTGKYLGTPDQSTTGQQSFYAVRDPLTAIPDWGPFRNLIGTLVVQQTLTQPSSTTRATTANAVGFPAKAGWVIDFNPGGASPGERSHTDATLDLGTLTFTTNVPSSGNCVIGGTSYLYFLDYTTGGPVSSSTGGVSGQFLGRALATRPVVVRLPNNKVISLTRLSDGTTVSLPIPIGTSGTSGRRINWREINTAD